MPVSVRTERLKTAVLSPAELRKRGERMLRSLRMEDMELSVLLCDDRTIHRLNRDYRKKDKPTDVLAFAMGEGEGLDASTGLLGDVVISVPTAKRQAKEKRCPAKDEVTMLLAHGLLHLLGYDHQTRKEERIMLARTDVLCAAAVTKRSPTKPTRKTTNTKTATKRRTKGAATTAKKRKPAAAKARRRP